MINVYILHALTLSMCVGWNVPMQACMHACVCVGVGWGWWWWCACVCAFICLYMWRCVSAYACACVPLCVCVCVCVCVRTRARVHVLAQECVWVCEDMRCNISQTILRRRRRKKQTKIIIQLISENSLGKQFCKIKLRTTTSLDS